MQTAEGGSPVADLKPLTSLRFVAAMMIVVLHSKLYFPWPWLDHTPGWLVHGVSFFFVLSGFILTHSYVSKPFPGYRPFMLKRFARLWPVHVFALLMLLTFVRPDSITFDGPGFFNKWYALLSNLTLTQSLVPFKAYTFSYNSVSWSISTEAFFYLAFPLLLANIRKTWHVKLIGAGVCALLFTLACQAANLPFEGSMDQVTIASTIYGNPLVRGFEFCLGMATWVAWDRYARHSLLSASMWTKIEGVTLAATIAWLGYGAWVVRGIIPTTTLQFLFNENGSCWMFALLIVVMASGRGWFGKMLSTDAAVFLGKVSFCVYMLHQVLMKMFFTWNQAQTVSTAAFFAALLFIASATYLMIESPAQRFLTKKRTASRPIGSPHAGAANVHASPELMADQR
jgi:peptidoglycan/LPS O-acetylase OafA/YrhL